jgi:hypothetical protein
VCGIIATYLGALENLETRKLYECPITNWSIIEYRYVIKFKYFRDNVVVGF